jgi:sarcosine oxidase gamma subunit
MSELLDFLSPDRADAEARWRSPLERALEHAPAEIADVSLTGKLDVRGDLDSFDAKGAELIRITPERGLVLCDFTKTPNLRTKLADRFLVVDMSGALAGLQLRGEALMRRLTDLDLDSLPAVGAAAHVQAYVLRDDAETFRLFFPQEYGHYVAEVVVDAAEGLSS